MAVEQTFLMVKPDGVRRGLVGEVIGRFERNDILWVAHHLKSFPGRIVRDRWIEQAQTLANQRRD